MPVITEDLIEDPPAEEVEAEVFSEEVSEEADAADGGEAVEGEVEQEDGDELVVTIEGEETQEDEPTAGAPDWVKTTRERNRQLAGENKSLKRRLQELEGGQQPEAPIVVGDKPTMESVDFDADEFAEALEAWHGRKLKADEQQAKREAAQKAEADAWAKRLESYAQAKTKLRASDFDEAEAAVQDALSQTQQGLLVVAGKDAAASIVYALHKNPRRLRSLAAISDPVEFAAEVGELRKAVKVETRTKTAPAPERRISGSAPGAVSRGLDEKRLNDLREKAYASGDMTEYLREKERFNARKRA